MGGSKRVNQGTSVNVRRGSESVNRSVYEGSKRFLDAIVDVQNDQIELSFEDA